MTLAQTERAALSDLMAKVGPEQPTLCDGWRTADLLAHLLLRERRMDAALGVVIAPLAWWSTYVAAQYKRLPWIQAVELLRSGPPWWSPLHPGPVDAKVNGMEMFIHHEDVRRAQAGWQPRKLDAPTRDQLLLMATSMLVLRGLRKFRVPVTARLTDEPGEAERPIVLVPSVRAGGPGREQGVVIRGGIAEILLWLTGRTEVHLEFVGDAAVVAKIGSGKRIGPGAVSFDT